MLEEVRKKLRLLVPLIERSKKGVIYSDFGDDDRRRHRDRTARHRRSGRQHRVPPVPQEGRALPQGAPRRGRRRQGPLRRAAHRRRHRRPATHPRRRRRRQRRHLRRGQREGRQLRAVHPLARRPRPCRRQGSVRRLPRRQALQQEPDPVRQPHHRRTHRPRRRRGPAGLRVPLRRHRPRRPRRPVLRRRPRPALLVPSDAH